MRKILLQIFSIFIVLASAIGVYGNARAAGSLFYVSTTGNDLNAGTEQAPFKTIQKCVNTAPSGSTCIVLQGTYPEQVKISQSGLTLEATGKVTTRQFYISGSNNTVRGFTITDVTANNGIQVNGNFNLFESNEIYQTKQDGIWFFGHDNTFRTNYIHDILDPSITGDPHVDCFQTWDWSWDTYNILFEGNICDHTRPADSNQIVMISGVRVHDVTFRANRFIMHDAGYSPINLAGGTRYVVDKNYFCNTTGQGTPAIYLSGGTNVSISNNSHAGYASLYSGSGVVLDQGNLQGSLPCQVMPSTDEMPGDPTASAPVVLNIKRDLASPTAANVVTFTVSFSEAVLGVDAGDFAINTSGAISGVAIASLTSLGAGDSYTLSVKTGSGDGMLWLDLLDDDSIVSAANLPLGGVGIGNGSFLDGEAYQMLRSPLAFGKTTLANGAVSNSLTPTLGWNPSVNAAAYEVCYDTTNDNACAAWTNNGTAVSIKLGTLVNNTTYYWQVRALNAQGTTPADSGAYWSFSTAAAPGSFAKSKVANGSVNNSLTPSLSWNPSLNAASYEVCYDTTNDNACSNWINNGTSTTAVLSGLKINTTYYWQVRAVNGIGTTPADNGVYWSFTTGTIPTWFNKISVANLSKNVSLTPTMTWGASTGAAVYEICYDTTNDNACSNWISKGTSTSAVLSGLKVNTTYYWQVRARNGFGTRYANAGAYWSFTTRK